MTDYEYEIKQKKDIARQVKYKNRKHRGCSLPSDNLTAAQKRRLNSKVIELDTTKRILWNDLKQYPVRMQAEYLNNLVRRFGCNFSQLRCAIGVSGTTFSNICKTIKDETGSDILKPKFRRGVYQMSEEIQNQYREFVGLLKFPNKGSQTDEEPDPIPTPPFYIVASRSTIVCEKDLDKFDSEIIAKDLARTIELYTKNITNSDKKVLISFKIKRVSKDYSLDHDD